MDEDNATDRNWPRVLPTRSSDRRPVPFAPLKITPANGSRNRETARSLVAPTLLKGRSNSRALKFTPEYTSVMPRAAHETRTRILESAYRLFYKEGFHRTGIDAVAEAAQVTKRTLYNHFSSKDALIAAVLQAQSEPATQEIRRWSGKGAATAEEIVSRMFSDLRSWSRNSEWRGSGFTRAAMELAWAPGHPARAVAAAHKRQLERDLAETLRAAVSNHPDRLARELLLLVEGAMALRLIHGDETWFHSAEAAALELVARDGSSRPPEKRGRPHGVSET